MTRCCTRLERVVEHGRAAGEQHETGDDERDARGRGVEHREEDPEVEERRAEVARLDEHEHRGAPDREERAEVLEAPPCERLPLVPQVPGEEDDEEDLRELARLEPQRADVDPELDAVDPLPQPRDGREHQEHDRRDPEDVLVPLEDPVVVAQPDEHEGEDRDADGDPDELAAPVLRLEAVDEREPDRADQRGEREQRRVGVGHRPARHEVGDEEDPGQDTGPRQPAVVDRRQIGQPGARERGGRDEPGEDEREQLAVPGAHRSRLHQRTKAATARSARTSRSAGHRLPFPAPCRRTSSTAVSLVSASGSAEPCPPSATPGRRALVVRLRRSRRGRRSRCPPRRRRSPRRPGPRRRRAGRPQRVEHARDLVVAHHRVRAVGAEQDEVSRGDLERPACRPRRPPRCRARG